MKLPPVITSKSNERVKALRSAFSGRASKPGDLVGVEGIRMLVEAFRSRVRMETIYVREGIEDLTDMLPEQIRSAAPFVVLSRAVYDSVVDTQHAQPIAATCEIPARPVPELLEEEGVVLVLEGLQDPGNVGTLLRSAEAFAVQQVFLTPGTANPWNPKVLRASAGSAFRVPLVKATLADVRRLTKGRGIPLLAAVPQETGARIASGMNFGPRCALMIGNEGNGLSAEALKLADERVYIPCWTESLNAAIAGSVLMYEALRQGIVASAAELDEAMPKRMM